MSKFPSLNPNLDKLPEYVFVHLNKVKAKARAAGKEIIDLGMGNPDRPSPKHVVDALAEAVKTIPGTHRYPTTKGIPALRKAIADWYEKRFGVLLDPETEVLPLIGSKEGLAHMFAAFLTPKDAALIPSPCYPVHVYGSKLTGAHVHDMPLREENAFLPDLGEIPAKIARKSKFLVCNYPNNPTGAVVEDMAFFKETLRFAKKHGALVVHDNPYSEITFDGYRAPSFLELPGSRQWGVEFHSLSKTYSMAGWRIGFVVGNAKVLAAISRYKSFLDYGIPGFIQEAAVSALTGPQDYVADIRALYEKRRNFLCDALTRNGWAVERPKASMYLWAKVPAQARKKGVLKFAEKLILEEGVTVAPGTGFGRHGEGFVRFAFIEDEAALAKAADRIGRFLTKK